MEKNFQLKKECENLKLEISILEKKYNQIRKLIGDKKFLKEKKVIQLNHKNLVQQLTRKINNIKFIKSTVETQSVNVHLSKIEELEKDFLKH